MSLKEIKIKLSTGDSKLGNKKWCVFYLLSSLKQGCSSSPELRGEGSSPVTK